MYADSVSAPENPEEAETQSGMPLYAEAETETTEALTPMLDRYGTDLTALAREGMLDPMVGREEELAHIVQTLSRRRKNNPLLVGEAGVGKTSLVEGLATRIATHDTATLSLEDRRIIRLDLASVLAGTQYRGQFEERIQKIVKELRAHREIILYIDEIHNIVGAGNSSGAMDAAEMLKPALAKGEVQCIGATTPAEYRRTFEKNAALSRRFQRIAVEATNDEHTLQILQAVKPRYEAHHHVHYTDEALRACVSLTQRYVTDRPLPDKAIDVLDEAGSFRHIANTLPLLQPAHTKLAQIDALKQQKEAAVQSKDFILANKLRLEIERIKEVNKSKRTQTSIVAEQTAIHPEVNASDIASVVAKMTGIPTGRMVASDTVRLRGLKEALLKNVVGQDPAVEHLSRAVVRGRLGLRGKGRPIGSFLFVGPTGVGKTWLVKCLAEQIFGNADALVRIDMSEYAEKHTVSRLLGAPPGYVGYEEGGQLTERVRRKPYSVVLLDEIEKAHPDVWNTLLQVMDEGRITDSSGFRVDFTNTVLVLTSNSGTRNLSDGSAAIGFGTSDDLSPEETERIVRKALKQQFPPEFLNRLDDIIVFRPLTEETANRIARLEVERLAKHLLQDLNLRIEVSNAACQWLVTQGFDHKFGARSLKRAIQQHIEDPLCDYLLDASEESATSSHSFTIDFDKKQNKLVFIPQ